MLATYRLLFWGFIAISATLIVVFGYIASTESDGPRKGRAKLIATLAFASWFIVGPISQLVYESKLPTYEFSGVINSVRVDNHSSKYYSAWLTIITTAGGEITVHVSESSNSWIAGQHLRIRYYGDTGEMLRTELLDSDGRQLGFVNSTAGFSRYVSILVGLFLCWAGYKIYRRDPQGAEVEPHTSRSFQIDTLLAQDQDSPTQGEIDQMKENGKQQFSKQKARVMITGAAVFSGCGLVYLFSAGHSLHRYWDSAGAPLLAVTFALLLLFTFSAITVVSAWMYTRNLERINSSGSTCRYNSVPVSTAKIS